MNFETHLAFGSSNLCQWSPNGKILAVLESKCRLVLRDAASLDVQRTEVMVGGSGSSSEDNIDLILFSPDSQFILASDFKSGLTFVYKTGSDKESSTWKAKISEGMAGITNIRWSPDSRHIIALAEFNIKLTVWSLVQKLVRYIKFPKNDTCVEFSGNGQYLAVVERRDGKDCLSLFHSAKDWRVARHFELLPEMDTQGVLWSVNSDLIAVYSTKLQCCLAVYSLDGRCLFLYRPEDLGLSLFSVAWTSCGSVLAIATTNGISLINCWTWTLISDLEVPVKLDDNDPKMALFIETQKQFKAEDVDVRIARELCSTPLDTEYVLVQERPIDLLPNKKSKCKRLHNIDLQFSKDNKYLMAKSSSNHLVWIWDIHRLQLYSILVHDSPISSTIWSPLTEKIHSLMILTTKGLLHLWTFKGVLCLSLPPLDKDYGRIKDVQWNPVGKALAITCQDGIVCCRIGKI